MTGTRVDICRTKTVAIRLQLFYYVGEMENDYKKRNYMESNSIKKEILREVRREITAMSEIDDRAAMDIIVNKTFDCPEVCAMPLDEAGAMIKGIFYRIRTQMGILTPLIEDGEITEIMVNGRDRIFFEKNGEIRRYDMSFDSDEELEEIMQNIAAQVHREINELNPIVDARLKDGSRVSGVYKNISVNGPTLTIRKFSDKYMKMEDLVFNGTLPAEAADLLKRLVESRKNIFVSGGTSSGKTTLLNALGQFIGRDERVIVIEDSAELKFNYIENLVQMECRQANALGRGQVTMSELIKSSLRMRPDRIIVGEVRGKEVLDMIQAMNTGHSGSMSTGHGNSIKGMFKRLEAMYLTAVSVDIEAVRSQIAEAIDIMVHIERRGPDRRVTEIRRLYGYENGRYETESLMEMRDGILKRTGEIYGL